MMELPPSDRKETQRDSSLGAADDPGEERTLDPEEGMLERNDRPLGNNTNDGYVICEVARVDLEEDELLFENENIEETKTINGRGTGLCRICLETLNDPLPLDCGHEFCGLCTSQYCGNQKILPITCPDQTCQYILPVRLLSFLLGDDTLIDLVKQYKVRNHAGFKCCPFCHELLRLPPGQASAKDLHCANCERTFCRIHDTEHLNVLCQDYLATVRAIDAFTKPCSHCGTNLQKSAGCDHVVCKYCNGDMCWKCGTHEYLSGTVRKKCSKCCFNLLDYRFERIHRRRLLLWMPVILPLCIVYVVLLTGLCVLSCCFCGCMLGGRCVFGPPHANFRVGVLASLFLIFLPFIAVLENFGVRFKFVADIFPPEQQHNNEIPFLTIRTAESMKV